MQGLVNIVDREEQPSQNPTFFPATLRFYMEAQCVLLDFHAYVVAVESVNLY